MMGWREAVMGGRFHFGSSRLGSVVCLGSGGVRDLSSVLVAFPIFFSCQD